jgi:hypothetical protein
MPSAGRRAAAIFAHARHVESLGGSPSVPEYLLQALPQNLIGHLFARASRSTKQKKLILSHICATRAF